MVRSACPAFFVLSRSASPQLIWRSVQGHRRQTHSSTDAPLKRRVYAPDQRRLTPACLLARLRSHGSATGSTTSAVNVSPGWLVFTLMRWSTRMPGWFRLDVTCTGSAGEGLLHQGRRPDSDRHQRIHLRSCGRRHRSTRHRRRGGSRHCFRCWPFAGGSTTVVVVFRSCRRYNCCGEPSCLVNALSCFDSASASAMVNATTGKGVRAGATKG